MSEYRIEGGAEAISRITYKSCEVGLIGIGTPTITAQGIGKTNTVTFDGTATNNTLIFGFRTTKNFLAK